MGSYFEENSTYHGLLFRLSNTINLFMLLLNEMHISKNKNNDWIFRWMVDCDLTSHLAIFQLCSDGTVVQFPNFDLLPGTKRNGQLWVFSVPSLP